MTDNTSLLHRKIKEQLRQWAKQYNTKDFILSDPIQFPHRYSQIKDILNGVDILWQPQNNNCKRR